MRYLIPRRCLWWCDDAGNMQVERFRIGQITLRELNRDFDAQINNMVEQKYASLAKYFQDGNSMETLYTGE